MLLLQRLSLALLLIASPFVSASSLPDLSSSTSRVLSTEEQHRLGESLYRGIVESGQLISDPVVNNYINNLGQHLLSAAPHSPYTFTFFVIDNPQINAFAMFGGYIGIYSGLISAAKTDAELASVIAHEIAHVTQNHLLRTIEKSSHMEGAITAALLAAILLGGDAPELAEAAVTTVIAGQQQQQLSFSRSHEQEADRLGIERLSSANFDPHAMARFFSLLHEKSRYSATAPEFLQTHPVTTERISEAQNRAYQLPSIEDSSTIELQAIQARLTLSHNKDSDQLIRELTGQRGIKEQYTLALALIENQRYKEALEIIKIVLKEFPNVLSFQLTKATIYQAMNRWKLAEESYREILDISPYNRPTTTALVKLHMVRGEYKKGRDLLIKLAQYTPLKADEFRLLAKIAHTQNNSAERHINLSEAFILEGKSEQALNELLAAKKYTADNFYLNNRVDARIEEIQAISTLKKRQEGIH